MLKILCVYDTHIGRLNYERQSPLGVARFSGSLDAADFLQQHYRKIRVDEFGYEERNKVGDIWWEKEFEDLVDEWKVIVGVEGERMFVHKITGETRSLPPSITINKVANAAQYLEVPLRKVAQPLHIENHLNIHGYKEEHARLRDEVALYALENISAICLQKYIRRHLVKRKTAYMRYLDKKRKRIAEFIYNRHTSYQRYLWRKRSRNAIKIQHNWRGHTIRKYLLHSGELEKLRYNRNLIKLSVMLSRLWHQYQRKRRYNLNICKQIAPTDRLGWRKLVANIVKPVRTIDFIAEYKFPRYSNVFFYCNTITGDCTFEKPYEIQFYDDLMMKERKERYKYVGYTYAQKQLVIRIQKLWRGYWTHVQVRIIEEINKLCLMSEEKFLSYPNDDQNLYNYALDCFVMKQDYVRSRHLFQESMRRMEYRGPDIAFVLYCYAIYCFVTHDMDYTDCILLLSRARIAEEQQFNYHQMLQAKEELAAEAFMKIKNKDKDKKSSSSSTSKEQLLGEQSKESLSDNVSTMKSKAVDLLNKKKNRKDKTLTWDTLRYGRALDRARIGFFKQSTKINDNAGAWHQYAACQFLVYNDGITSIDAFLAAVQRDNFDQKIRSNFDIMMRHFHSSDPKITKKIINDRVKYLAIQNAAEFALPSSRRGDETARRISKSRSQRGSTQPLSSSTKK